MCVQRVVLPIISISDVSPWRDVLLSSTHSLDLPRSHLPYKIFRCPNLFQFIQPKTAFSSGLSRFPPDYSSSLYISPLHPTWFHFIRFFSFIYFICTWRSRDKQILTLLFTIYLLLCFYICELVFNLCRLKA